MLFLYTKLKKSAQFQLILVALFLLSGITYFGYTNELFKLNSDPKEITSATILYFGLIFAIIGWLVTAKVSLHNSTKQHTINVLLQSRLSNTFKNYRDTVSKEYPEYPEFNSTEKYAVTELKKDIKIYSEDIENQRKYHKGALVTYDPQLSGNKKEAIEAFKYLLNYYEFIAAGILNNDLDETLMKECLRSIILDICERGQPLIDFIRKVDAIGYALYPKFYENLLLIKVKWED